MDKDQIIYGTEMEVKTLSRSSLKSTYKELILLWSKPFALRLLVVPLASTLNITFGALTAILNHELTLRMTATF